MGKYSIIITDRILIMSAFWRVAGLNYVQYSNIAAKTVRQALKGEAKDAAAKRGNQLSRVVGTILAFCLSRYRKHQIPEVGGWKTSRRKEVVVTYAF